MNKIHSVYMVGIKGVGMASLAVILKQQGKKVTGSDVKDMFGTDDILKKHHILVVEGFKKEHIERGIDLVITTAAHGGLQNPEVLEAIKNNIPVYTYAQALGMVMNTYKTPIAVCGSHGKTTTTALISYVLEKMNLDPSYVVGAASFSHMPSSRYGKGDYFIAEADEYVSSPYDDMHPKFYYMKPSYIICTNIDFDHPDVYENMEAIRNVFSDFFKSTLENKGTLIACIDDEEISRVIHSMSLDKVHTYGFSEKS